MPITVRYAPDARLVGEAAYGVGQGEREERDISRAQRERMQQTGILADLERQRRAQANQMHRMAIGNAYEQQARQQQMQAQAYRDQQRMAQQARMAQMEAAQGQMDFRRQQQLAAQEHQRRMEYSGYRAQQDAALAQLRAQEQRAYQDYKLSSAQQHQRQRIDAAIARVQADQGEYYTEQEKQHALDQLIAAREGIQPMPTPEEQAKPRPIDEVLKEQTTEHADGTLLGLDQNGKLYTVHQPQSGRDLYNLIADLTKEQTTVDDRTGKETKPPMSRILKQATFMAKVQRAIATGQEPPEPPEDLFGEQAQAAQGPGYLGQIGTGVQNWWNSLPEGQPQPAVQTEAPPKQQGSWWDWAPPAGVAQAAAPLFRGEEQNAPQGMPIAAGAVSAGIQQPAQQQGLADYGLATPEEVQQTLAQAPQDVQQAASYLAAVKQGQAPRNDDQIRYALQLIGQWEDSQTR